MKLVEMSTKMDEIDKNSVKEMRDIKIGERGRRRIVFFKVLKVILSGQNNINIFFSFDIRMGQ